MKRFLYSTIKLQPLAVFLFILLNCLFTAAPLLLAASDYSHSISAPVAPLHQNSNDLEENLRVSDISVQRQDLRFNNRNTINKVSISNYSLQELMPDAFLAKQAVQQYFWIRPGYYHFLSLFHLF